MSCRFVCPILRFQRPQFDLCSSMNPLSLMLIASTLVLSIRSIISTVCSPSQFLLVILPREMSTLILTIKSLYLSEICFYIHFSSNFEPDKVFSWSAGMWSTERSLSVTEQTVTGTIPLYVDVTFLSSASYTNTPFFRFYQKDLCAPEHAPMPHYQWSSTI